MTSYTLDDDELKASTALGKKNIPYSSVTKIVDTNKQLVSESMFVLSSERIVLFYGENKKLSISPRSKPEVLELLKSKCSNAAFEEDLKVDADGNRVAERKPLVKEKEPGEQVEKKEKKPLFKKKEKTEE
jgi:hypothetical protein